MQEDQSNEIRENPQGNQNMSNEIKDYDFVVSEAAVGNYEGVPFTVAGILLQEVEGKKVPTTYLDIDKSRFVDIFDGTEFELKKGVKLKVIRIEFANPPEKGKIYFKRIQ